jgi:hypothetical protein
MSIPNASKVSTSLTRKCSGRGDKEYSERKGEASESWVTHRGSIDSGSSQREPSSTADGTALQCSTVTLFSMLLACRVACSLTCNAPPLVQASKPSWLILLSDSFNEAGRDVGMRRSMTGGDGMQSDSSFEVGSVMK